MISVHKAVECGTVHNITLLSAVSCSVSIILCLTTTPCNIVLIIAILEDKRKVLKKSIFYKLILNSAIADLLIGSLGDISSIAFHIKEAMRIKIYNQDIFLVHLELFVLSNASILSMALLCIDRIVALMKPIAYYRSSLSNLMCLMVLVATWIISGLLVIPYFSVGYIYYLGIFAFTTLTITCISLVAVVYFYKTRFPAYCNFNQRHSVTYKTNEHNLSNINSCQNSTFVLPMSNQVKNKAVNIKTIKNIELKKKTAEQKVNQSFIVMLLVFLLTYMPACCLTVYMNVCTQCTCTEVQIFRDFTYLSLLSGSLWRSLNFGFKITTLNKKIRKMLTFGHFIASKKNIIKAS